MSSTLAISYMFLTTSSVCFSALEGANHPLPAADTSAQHQMQAPLDFSSGAFIPPASWTLTDPKTLPPPVKSMAVGKGSCEYPPSLNLTTEKFSGTLKEYLKIVKTINQKMGDEWKDLGTIQTEAGIASLSQVDVRSKWGIERMMHVIIVREGTAYILTAAALKTEFPNFYKEFFQSMKSLRMK